MGEAIKIYVIDRFKDLLAGLGKFAQAFKLITNGEWSKALESIKQGTGDLFGVESKKRLVENARKTAKMAQIAYHAGKNEIDRKENAKSTKIGGADTSYNILGGISNTKHDNPDLNTSNGSSLTSSINTGVTTKNQNISIGKFVENLHIHLEKGKHSVPDLKKAIEEAFMEINADVEKRLLNA